MTLANHITSLLYKHECIVVPGFGGFITSYQPAHISQSNHYIYPPSKKVAFNVYLNQNDGLLAKHLSEREQIGYTDALMKIETIVKDWMTTLYNGSTLVMGDIGSFTLDREKKLQFEPFNKLNYLEDSFGLKTIHFIPEENIKSEFDKKVAEELHQMSALRPSVPLPKEFRVKKSLARKIIGSAVVIAAVSWLGLNIYLVMPEKKSASSLNPFDSVIKHNESIQKPAAVIQKTETLFVPTNNASTVNKTDTPVSFGGEKTFEEKIKPEIQKVIEPAPVLSSTNYYLIAGAFSVPENADSFVEQLKQQGFGDASVVGQLGALSYVTVGGYANAADAAKKIDSLKSVNVQAWVMKNKF